MPGEKLCFYQVYFMLNQAKDRFSPGKSLAFYLVKARVRFASPPGDPQVKSCPTAFHQVDCGPARFRAPDLSAWFSPGKKLVRHGGARRAGPGSPLSDLGPLRWENCKMCDCLMLHVKVIFPTKPPVCAGDCFSRWLAFQPGKPTFTW